MILPTIISSYDQGRNNANLDETISRLNREVAYKDLSTIMVVPAFGSIPTRVVASWLGLMTPPNAKFCRLFAVGMEVGEAYSQCIEAILAHPDLSNWRYLLTLEHDNGPPPDGLLKLLQRAEAHPEFSVIGGLYFVKGYGNSVAQCWGAVDEHPINFRPQKPNPDGILEVNGCGMGFTLFRLAMFKDSRLRRPWFETTADQQRGSFSQDLYFAMDARKHGYRFAVDGTVRVGHYSLDDDVMF